MDYRWVVGESNYELGYRWVIDNSHMVTHCYIWLSNRSQMNHRMGCKWIVDGSHTLRIRKMSVIFEKSEDPFVTHYMLVFCTSR